MIKDPGLGLGREAFRLTNLVAKRSRWIPGRIKGVPVEVKGKLKIYFALKYVDSESGKYKAIPGFEYNFEKYPKLRPAFDPSEVDELARPLSITCPGRSNSESYNSCAELQFYERIYLKMEYPVKAMKKNISGTAVLAFRIDKEGKLSKPKLKEDPGHGLGKEALRIFNTYIRYNRLFPTKKDGKSVSGRYELPIVFKY